MPSPWTYGGRLTAPYCMGPAVPGKRQIAIRGSPFEIRPRIPWDGTRLQSVFPQCGETVTFFASGNRSDHTVLEDIEPSRVGGEVSRSARVVLVDAWSLAMTGAWSPLGWK